MSGARQTFLDCFGVCWKLLVQPAILMATYNGQVRGLFPASARPQHMSYGAAICLRLFAGALCDSYLMLTILQHVAEMNKRQREQALLRSHGARGTGANIV